METAPVLIIPNFHQRRRQSPGLPIQLIEEITVFLRNPYHNWDFALIQPPCLRCGEVGVPIFPKIVQYCPKCCHRVVEQYHRQEKKQNGRHYRPGHIDA